MILKEVKPQSRLTRGRGEMETRSTIGQTEMPNLCIGWVAVASAMKRVDLSDICMYKFEPKFAFVRLGLLGSTNCRHGGP